LFKETLRFKLPRQDVRFVRRNIDVILSNTSEADVRERDESLLRVV
jgi:hypothetical protein